MASTSENSIPAASAEKKMIVLRSSDGETFELEEAAARMSETVKNMIEDDCAGDVIPLPNVDSATLTRVAQFCKSLTELDDKDLDGFKKEFISEVKDNQSQLFDLILAANYLSIKDLLDVSCQTVADMIKNKSPEEIRKTFNIKNDFTPEEEAAVREENAWAFQ